MSVVYKYNFWHNLKVLVCASSKIVCPRANLTTRINTSFVRKINADNIASRKLH